MEETNDNIYLIEEDFGVTPHPITHKNESVKKFIFGNKHGVKIQVNIFLIINFN